ncbi:MAG: hypothetical protein HRU10_10420 [Opitutales bacterium]|nr:hypothetical protein [Opitutales bacterium]
MSRDPALRLEDILESIEVVECYTADVDYDGFCNDPKTVDAVTRRLLILKPAIQSMLKQSTES